MLKKPKPPSSRGELNIRLNDLVKAGVIVSYDVQVTGDAAMIAVTAEAGADQAMVVQRVRGALPAAFSEAQVRTIAG